MYFDYQDKLLVCTIDKVMSTTFLAHFKKLALKRKPNFIKLETSRDDTRDIFYGIDKGLQFCIIFVNVSKSSQNKFILVRSPKK